MEVGRDSPLLWELERMSGVETLILEQEKGRQALNKVNRTAHRVYAQNFVHHVFFPLESGAASHSLGNPSVPDT